MARLLQLEPGASIELVRLAGESGVTLPTVRKLIRLGLITVTAEVDLPRLTANMGPAAGDGAEPDIALNEDQQKAFNELLPRLRPAVHDAFSPAPGTPGEGGGGGLGRERAIDDPLPSPPPEYQGRETSGENAPLTRKSGPGFSVNLLLGVTGSGKTEIYLQCIREVVNAGRQAIVLVPEIALTPQTVRRFTARFKSVAILHSGLTATDRHRYWQMISAGQAQVVVGRPIGHFRAAAQPRDHRRR